MESFRRNLSENTFRPNCNLSEWNLSEWNLSENGIFQKESVKNLFFLKDSILKDSGFGENIF
jgi:hypothetical protein